jgi:hypothetical protein
MQWYIESEAPLEEGLATDIKDIREDFHKVPRPV